MSSVPGGQCVVCEEKKLAELYLCSTCKNLFHGGTCGELLKVVRQTTDDSFDPSEYGSGSSWQISGKQRMAGVGASGLCGICSGQYPPDRDERRAQLAAIEVQAKRVPDEMEKMIRQARGNKVTAINSAILEVDSRIDKIEMAIIRKKELLEIQSKRRTALEVELEGERARWRKTAERLKMKPQNAPEIREDLKSIEKEGKRLKWNYDNFVDGYTEIASDLDDLLHQLKMIEIEKDELRNRLTSM